MLLLRHASIDGTSNNGRTALLWAATWGHARIVEYLLTSHANIEAQDKQGMTALQIAASQNHSNVVEVLLLKGANIYTKNIYGGTAKTIAIVNGHDGVINRLFSHERSHFFATWKNLSYWEVCLTSQQIILEEVYSLTKSSISSIELLIGWDTLVVLFCTVLVILFCWFMNSASCNITEVEKRREMVRSAAKYRAVYDLAYELRKDYVVTLPVISTLAVSSTPIQVHLAAIMLSRVCIPWSVFYSILVSGVVYLVFVL